MTNAMKRKFENAVKDFQNEHDGYYVHGCIFHHYGDDYRIEENEREYRIYRLCKNDIHDTLIEIITK